MGVSMGEYVVGVQITMGERVLYLCTLCFCRCEYPNSPCKFLQIKEGCACLHKQL